MSVMNVCGQLLPCNHLSWHHQGVSGQIGPHDGVLKTMIWIQCDAVSVNGMQAKNVALQKETTELQDLREDLSRQQKELCKQEAEAAAASADAKVTSPWTIVLLIWSMPQS